MQIIIELETTKRSVSWCVKNIKIRLLDKKQFNNIIIEARIPSE
ncbi:MAG: hypothetical protein RSC42_02150 [Clostridium sp.]